MAAHPARSVLPAVPFVGTARACVPLRVVTTGTTRVGEPMASVPQSAELETWPGGDSGWMRELPHEDGRRISLAAPILLRIHCAATSAVGLSLGLTGGAGLGSGRQGW